MKDLNYETLLTLHYLLEDIVKTQSGLKVQIHKTFMYYSETTKEIHRRIDSNKLGIHRFVNFPWGTQHKYVDLKQLDIIIEDIRSGQINKVQEELDESTDILNNGDISADVYKHGAS